jgi:hypothetical protein
MRDVSQAESGAPEVNNSTDLELTLKTRYGSVSFESDRDGDVMIELEEQIGTPRTYLNREECRRVRDFLNEWLARE